jgi:hypothetical protein
MRRDFRVVRGQFFKCDFKGDCKAAIISTSVLLLIRVLPRLVVCVKSRVYKTRAASRSRLVAPVGYQHYYSSVGAKQVKDVLKSGPTNLFAFPTSICTYLNVTEREVF